jgi:hypothetical protein
MLGPWPGLWKDCSAPGGKLNPRPSWSVRIRIPGLTSGAGGEIRASDAAMFCTSPPLLLVLCWRFEVGGGMKGVVEPEGDFAGASVVMVDWEEEREKVLASGARCVSFSSVVCQRQGVKIEVMPTPLGIAVDRAGWDWRRRTLGELPRHGWRWRGLWCRKEVGGRRGTAVGSKFELRSVQ